MGCGGNSVQVQQPAPAPTTAEAVTAWKNALPEIYQTQLEYAPKEAAQQLQLLQQYGLPLSQTLQGIDKALYPQTAGLQETLAGIAQQGSTATSMPDWMRKQYMSDFNSQLGSNAGSPIGADYVSRGMQQQLYNQQQQYQNMALSLAGRQPLTSASQGTPQYTNYASTFTPTGVANQQMTAYNSYMPYWQNYANQQGMLSMMPSKAERAGMAWGQYFAGQNWAGL